jgi:hypothetical protein
VRLKWYERLILQFQACLGSLPAQHELRKADEYERNFPGSLNN